MFNLSMASKELFHSNMLYWISLSYPQLFLKILNDLNVETCSWKDKEWVTYREKNHFDLSVYAKNGNKEECLLIVENKVKSIPHTDQLNEYKDKVNTQNAKLLLLSLTTDLPNREYIEGSGWIIKNYQELSLAIFSVLPSITDIYHRLLLEDYSMCILSLHEKQLSWKYDVKKSYIKQFVNAPNEEKSLRIEDMRKKVLYSRLAGELQNRLNAKLFTNNQITNPNNPKDSGIYVNYGMTRSIGLLDIKIRIEGNFMFVIQLQGESYRHCVETLDKDGITFVNDIKLRLANNNPVAKKYSSHVDAIVNEFLNPLNNNPNNSKYPFKESCFVLPKTRKTKQGENRAYNQYGQTFIYQYVKLTEGAAVKDVINGIISDVNKVNKFLGKQQFNKII